MFNNWYVMSATNAQKYCHNVHDNKAIIISINNSFESPVKLTCTKTNKVIEILTLSFDDVLKHNLIQDSQYPHIFTDEFGRAYSPISKKDAEKIHDIVMRWYKSSENVDLIVHCEMGVSRSAAVMAAILKGLYNDDMPIYKNSKYRPNPDVYRAVYNVFEENFMEDNMIVDKKDLRFSIKDTPFNYNPILHSKVDWDTIYYVPSNKLCEVFPDVKVISEDVKGWGTGLPYNNFTFAIVGENESLGKGRFHSRLSVDKEMKEYIGEDSTYKDTLAWKLIEEHKVHNLPDISVETSTEMIDGVEYEMKYYKIKLYNLTSPYFYQKSFDYYTNDNVRVLLVELEYSLPEGAKTWGYYSFDGNLCEEYLKYVANDKGQIGMYTLLPFILQKVRMIKECNYNPTEVRVEEGFWEDTMFIGVKGEDDDFDDYKIHVFAQKLDGESFEITYSPIEWKVDYPKLTGVRFVYYEP